MLRRRVGKYRVSPKLERTRLGVLYDSKLEMRYADRLELMSKSLLPDRERPVSWKRQVSIPMEVNGCWVTTYRADFEVTFADGHKEIHEVKGFATREWAIKERLFRALWPERRLVVIR